GPGTEPDIAGDDAGIVDGVGDGVATGRDDGVAGQRRDGGTTADHHDVGAAAIEIDAGAARRAAHHRAAVDGDGDVAVAARPDALREDRMRIGAHGEDVAA